MYFFPFYFCFNTARFAIKGATFFGSLAFGGLFPSDSAPLGAEEGNA